jgi:hypothetical protein
LIGEHGMYMVNAPTTLSVAVVCGLYTRWSWVYDSHVFANHESHVVRRAERSDIWRAWTDSDWLYHRGCPRADSTCYTLGAIQHGGFRGLGFNPPVQGKAGDPSQQYHLHMEL